MALAIGTTDVDLCSRALLLLGVKGITSLTQGGDKVDTCAVVYPMVRNKVLGLYGWKFTMSKVQLARDLNNPVSEWQYQYALPPDRAATGLLTLYPTNGINDLPIQDYELQGKRVLTNETQVWADYQQTKAEADFPTHVQQLIVYDLAASLAEAVTDDTSKAERWQKMAYGTPEEQGQGGYYRTARQIDSMGQPGKRIQRFPLVEVRG